MSEITFQRRRTPPFMVLYSVYIYLFRVLHSRTVVWRRFWRISGSSGAMRRLSSGVQRFGSKLKGYVETGDAKLSDLRDCNKGWWELLLALDCRARAQGDYYRVLEIGPGTAGYFSAEVARRIPWGSLELSELQREMPEKVRHRIEAARLRNVGFRPLPLG